MPSLLSKVVESQGQDTEALFIRGWVQSCIGDEIWAIHANGSLWYRRRVVISQSADLREKILREFH